jgi:YD repeat-containing protein
VAELDGYRFTHSLLATDVKNSLGERVSHRYTARGQVAESTYPDGTSEKFLYDLEGRLLQKTNRLDQVTRMSYDGVGRLLSVDDGEKVVHLAYDGDLLISGRCGDEETLYTYDPAGRLIAEQCGERVTEWQYDALGREERCIVWTSATDHVDTVWEYDLCNRVIAERVEDSRGKIWSQVEYAYDEAGNLIRCDESCITYDLLNRPICEIDPLGNETRYEYDGNQIRIIDPMGNIEEQIYDQRGHLITVERLDRAGVSVACAAYSYDAIGRRVEERQADQVVQWEYGPGGRLEAVYHNGTTYFEYEKGRCTAKILPGGEQITYGYDRFGRLQEERGPDYWYRYGYDSKGRLVSAEGADGTTLRSYDSHGQLLSERLSNGLTLFFSYDRAGRRIATRLPDGSEIKYEHDPIGVARVSRLRDSRQILSRDRSGRPLREQAGPLLWSYRWDGAGRLVERESPDGSVNLAYDKLGRLTSIEGQDGSGAPSERAIVTMLYHK